MNSFTAETRRQLKREQKTRVMENLGRCIGIQLMISCRMCCLW